MRNPRPLTADAAIINHGKILLVKRRNPPFRGCYALPGGFVEPEETAADAAVRETREETGLSVKTEKLLGLYDDPGRDSRNTVTAAFLCSISGGEKPAPGSDAVEAKFFPLDSLPEKIAFDHRKIIEDSSVHVGKRKVLCGGRFNIIHPGHMHFLRKAKELGDELVVVVAADRTVKKDGKKLLLRRDDRAGLVEGISLVDRVIKGEFRGAEDVIRREKPDVIALGYDQDIKKFRKIVERLGISCGIKRIPLLEGYSTESITGGRDG